jgi:hypothetical protein
VPVGVLEDDGSIQFGTFRWPIEREGLPPRGVRRELIVDGERFGSVVLIPGSPNPVPQERLAAAATTIDVLALGIAEHRIGSRPGSGA